MNVGGWKCLFRELGIAITNGKFSQKLSNSFLREVFCDFFLGVLLTLVQTNVYDYT